MEELLKKLAKQLDGIDEASLLDLWEKYADIVNNFEPSERWQEAALILGFIQAKQWKNQLFNTLWSESQNPRFKANTPNFSDIDFSNLLQEEKVENKKAKILAFKPRENPEEHQEK